MKNRLGNYGLRPIDLVIPQGSIVGYIGENSASKSTTIKLLLNLMIPDEGEIKILGSHTRNFNPKQKKYVAYVFDDPYLPGDINLKNGLNFHRKFYGKAWQDKTFLEYIKDETQTVLVSSHILVRLRKSSRLHRLYPPG